MGEWGNGEWGNREWGNGECGNREWGNGEWGNGGTGNGGTGKAIFKIGNGNAGMGKCGNGGMQVNEFFLKFLAKERFKYVLKGNPQYCNYLNESVGVHGLFINSNIIIK
jgi:hypothetical protein